MDFDRQFPRTDAPLTFLLPDGWKAEVADISATGMKIRGLALLPKGQTLDGHLVLSDGRKVPTRVIVVWATPPDPSALALAEAGLEIVPPATEYLAAVAEIFAAKE